MPEGLLYLVATPIGNLEDISLRALRVLKEVDLIAAEDTRCTRKLLNHYGIKKPIISYFEPKEEKKVPILISKLKKGAKIALVSDAGTPAISDPGFKLIRAAIDEGLKVVPIPGASAVTAALIASGLPTHAFLFVGFLPRKQKAKEKILESLSFFEGTLIFFESPKRLKGLIEQMIKLWGDKEAVLAREITKVHEEFIRGSLSQILEIIKSRDLKGEIVLLVKAERKEQKDPGEEKLIELKRKGFSTTDIAKIAKIVYGLPKRQVYTYLKGKKK